MLENNEDQTIIIFWIDLFTTDLGANIGPWNITWDKFSDFLGLFLSQELECLNKFTINAL